MFELIPEKQKFVRALFTFRFLFVITLNSRALSFSDSFNLKKISRKIIESKFEKWSMLWNPSKQSDKAVKHRHSHAPRQIIVKALASWFLLYLFRSRIGSEFSNQGGRCREKILFVILLWLIQSASDIKQEMPLKLYFISTKLHVEAKKDLREGKSPEARGWLIRSKITCWPSESLS